jgi:large subunit ribosomal protein L6
VSRVGRMPIPIPPEVKIEIEPGLIKVEGPKGHLEQPVHRRLVVKQDDGSLMVERPADSKMFRSLHGLTRTLLSNMVTGVTRGHQKILEINGVGYRADLQGTALVLQLGLSHPVVFQPPEGIEFEIGPKGVQITIRGIDKQLVGQVAAKIRSFRPPEPYKGKGIRYQGESVRRKAGKAGA